MYGIAVIVSTFFREGSRSKVAARALLAQLHRLCLILGLEKANDNYEARQTGSHLDRHRNHQDHFSLDVC